MGGGAYSKLEMTLGCLQKPDIPDANDINRGILETNYGGPEGLWQELQHAKASGDPARIYRAAVLAELGGCLFADIALLVEVVDTLSRLLQLQLPKEEKKDIAEMLEVASRHRRNLGG